MYSYQKEVKDSPLIKAWLARVDAAMAAMDGVKVVFKTVLQDRCEENRVYHDHDNQQVAEFLPPVIDSSFPDSMDEECLPYYRIQFEDGTKIIADDAELFSMDPRFAEMIAAVSGAFGCARDLDFVGPWDLAAHGTEEQKAQFLDDYKSLEYELPFSSWVTNHNTPSEFKRLARAHAQAQEQSPGPSLS